MKIKIQDGDKCGDCRFLLLYGRFCCLFQADLEEDKELNELKCDKCKNKEEVEVSYGN